MTQIPLKHLKLITKPHKRPNKNNSKNKLIKFSNRKNKFKYQTQTQMMMYIKKFYNYKSDEQPV